MFSERERLRIEDIADYSARAIDFLGGATIEELEADLRTMLAIERCLQCVTEAAVQLVKPAWRKSRRTCDCSNCAGSAIGCVMPITTPNRP